MRRIAILGPGGAGKSWLARELSAVTEIRVVHLDRLFWKPGWVETPPAEWEALQRRELARRSWIVEGLEDDTMYAWLDAADTIVFLDLPPLRCIWRVTQRRLGSDAAVGTPAGSDPAPFHQAVPKFLRRLWLYQRTSRAPIVAYLAGRSEGQEIAILRNQQELSEFLAAVRRRSGT